MNNRYKCIRVVAVMGNYLFLDENETRIYQGSLASTWVYFGYKKLLNRYETKERVSLSYTGRKCYITEFEGVKVEVVWNKTIKAHTFDFRDATYFLYRHKGRRVSIFKGQEQIGYYEYERIHLYGEPFLSIYIDKNENIDLLVSVCYYWTCDFSDESDVSISGRHWGKEFLPFDDSWI